MTPDAVLEKPAITQSMRAMYLLEPGQFELREQPIYDVGPNDVLLKIAYCGVCPWDVRVYAGKKTVPLPRVMGHEATGWIAAAGEQVTHLQVGQRVMGDFIVKCGTCINCRRGRENRCQRPQFPSGAYAEYAVLPARNIHPIQHEATSMQAAAFTEPLACVVRGQKMLTLKPGDTELVIGAGPIGLMHMQVAKQYGARVIVADLIPERLNLAKELGADMTHNSTESSLKEAIMDWTEGLGLDAAVVTVPASPPVMEAIDCLGEGARLNIFAGIYPVNPLSVDPNIIHYKEIILTGSADSTPAEMHQALRYIESGAVQVEPLISHLLPLEEVPQGIETVLNRQGLKVMIQVADEA